MYRKEADRLIVRDVRERLRWMDDPDWQQAVIASWYAHPDWFRHHAERLLEGVGEMLQSAGVELVNARQPLRFVGNERSASED
jgi:hypothetical protein